MQECDTVVNKTFKAAIKASFRNLLHEQYDEHLAAGGNPVTWRPKLTMGALKPHMCGFVAMGIAALRKPTMTAAIARAFEEDGLFNEIRRSVRQQREHCCWWTPLWSTDFFLANWTVRNPPWPVRAMW